MRWLLLACGVAAMLQTALAVQPGPATKNNITHGPILGRLSSTGIGVWARTAEAGTFHVRFGTAPDKLDQLSPPAKTSLERDNTGWVHVEGLKPNTTYYYRLVVGDKTDTDQGGSFRTLPAAKDFQDAKLNPKGLFNFSFEFACGNNQNPAQGLGHNGPAFKTMLDRLQDKIHFAILNGDWLYEDARDFPVDGWLKKVKRTEKDLPPAVKVAPTLVGVWENYKLYLERGKNLAAWHRNVPSFFTFDDHEILNDVWGAGQPGVTERRAVFRDIGLQAWYDYLGWSNPMPHTQGIHFGKAELKKGSNILTDKQADFSKLDLKQAATLHVHWGKPTAGVNENHLDEEPPGEPNAGVYGIAKVLNKNQLQITPAPPQSSTASYSIGRLSYFSMQVSNCDFFFLDTRTHRDMHDLDQRDKPGISMIGKQQKAWLKEAMKNSKADFLFVLSSVNVMVPHVGGGAVRPQNKDDAWTVFLDERNELLKFFDGLKQPVFLLTGDLHNSFAIKITDNVWEFASGPHNSANHLASDEGDRPANGPYDSFGTKCDIRWSSYFLNDIPRNQLRHPFYCVVSINNVFNNPKQLDQPRWVAFPRPHVVFQYYDGRTGDLRYAESVAAW